MPLKPLRPNGPILSRRRFCAAVATSCAGYAIGQTADSIHFNVAEYERERLLAAAAEALRGGVKTLKDFPAPKRSGTGANVYYSEDTEWFASEGSSQYSHKQGYTNTAAFTAHRDAIVGLNAAVSALVAAWRLTHEERYATEAMKHLDAWCIDPATAMEPQLEHAATVPGQNDGSQRGVEETVMLAETARCASFLCGPGGPAQGDTAAALRAWFGAFAAWLNDSKRGGLARDAKDRLSVCWTLQAGEFSRFARKDDLQRECVHRFRDRLIRQMNFDGAFFEELTRADAFAASIFTLDCMSVTCEVLSTPFDRLWDYTLPDGRGMRAAMAFLYPSLQKRGRWPYRADSQHFSSLPARQPSLLLAGRAFNRPEYIETWKALPPEPPSKDMLRAFVVRQPSLWTVRAPA